MALLARERRASTRVTGPRRGDLFSDDLDVDLPVGRTTSTRATSPSRALPAPARPTAARTSSTDLITSGKRVGVIAMSHPAIDNLMAATYEVFADAGDVDELCALCAGRTTTRTATLDGSRRYSKQGATSPERVQPHRGHGVAVGEPGDAPAPRRRLDRRRGRPARARRRRGARRTARATSSCSATRCS